MKHGETWWNLKIFPKTKSCQVDRRTLRHIWSSSTFLPRRKVSDNCWSVSTVSTVSSEYEKMKRWKVILDHPKRLKRILKFEPNIWIGSTSNNATCVYKSPLELPWPPDWKGVELQFGLSAVRKNSAFKCLTWSFLMLCPGFLAVAASYSGHIVKEHTLRDVFTLSCHSIRASVLEDVSKQYPAH